MKQKTEFMQMIMLAHSEAEFLSSATAILHQIIQIEHAAQPVDLIVFGMTLTGIALLASEVCKRPVAGFVLQPSCIPSDDPDWTAVQSIDTHTFSLIDRFEELACNHKTLKFFK